jgi:hypothetical protein
VGLVDVQPQNQLGKASIALARDLNINANVKNRGERKSKLSCTSSLPGRSRMAVNNHSFDRFRAFERDG